MAFNFRKVTLPLQSNHSLNKRAMHMKFCWDEIASILDHACHKKCCDSDNKEHHEHHKQHTQHRNCSHNSQCRYGQRRR